MEVDSIFKGKIKALRLELAAAGALLALCLGFHILKSNREVMTFWAQEISKPIRYALARAVSFTSWSVAEWLVVGTVAVLALFLVHGCVCLIRGRGRRLRLLAKKALQLLDALLLLYFVMCLNWGAGYYAESCASLAGIEPEEATVEQLREVTEYFAQMASRASLEVERNPDGTLLIDLDETLAQGSTLFRELSEKYPFLEGAELLPKKARLSRLMSMMTTTGYLFPYTGEANINIDAPSCFIPVTVAHEISHQRGVASEQEANFFGILASVESGSAEFQYSGWLFGYVYLHNALITVDPEALSEIYSSLPEQVLADLSANSLYWDRFEDGAVADFSDGAYDSFLKGYGQELGRQSYGAVVDLLIAYFGQG